MKLRWFSTAAFTLTEGETTLAFDPFLGLPMGKRWPDLDGSGFREADAVLVTHGHVDHILEIPALLAGSEAPIYATRTPCRTLKRHGVLADRLQELRPGDALDLGPFRVRVYQGRHCRFDGPLIRQTVLSPRLWRHLPRALRLLGYVAECPERGETLFYELTAGGKRVQVMGSLGLDPSVDYPTEADALILPYQGRSDLVTCGQTIVRRLRPKAVYLDHWDDSFPPLTSIVDTRPFCDLLTGQGIPCRALAPEETIDL